jgi:hypothetical protein
MYAATANSKIYHLAERADERTLCGVRFMPILMERPRAAGLSLMQTKPEGYSLCRHCHRCAETEPHLRAEIFPFANVLSTKSKVVKVSRLAAQLSKMWGPIDWQLPLSPLIVAPTTIPPSTQLFPLLSSSIRGRVPLIKEGNHGNQTVN